MASEWVEVDVRRRTEAVGFLPLPPLTQSVVTEVGERTQYTSLACMPLRPPPPLYSACVIGAHNPVALAPPTREPSQGPDSFVGPSRWRSILTFSPLISPLYFKLLNFNLTLYFFFSCFAIGLILLQIST